MMNLEELYLGYYGKGNPLRCIPSTVFTLHSLVKLDASSCRYSPYISIFFETENKPGNYSTVII